MADSTIWWLIAGTVVVAELLTGTFYLLMLALGSVAAALAAHLGLSAALQTAAAAIVSSAALLACYQLKKKRPGDPRAPSEHSVNLDVGETVLIERWGTDGTATVKYRGAQWTAIHRPDATPCTGRHRVVELVGSRLLVDPL
ncbi:NfeD family protein [Verminephrobacter aporrectodeae subsp. tuberculatae]|nr:NfeD family protein [Verminephrobacter aporrectodeae]MCW8208040.1 NfeD family protein [Verminephrobacter aporrectodeae subsp. tuberculatae]